MIFFWLWRILHGNPGGPRLLWLRRANRVLQRFTPWQLIVSTLTGVYTVRNLDKILGLGAPEPLAGLYSPSYYRATWINTGLDAGFATAMSIRPKWLKDFCSVLFAVYYIIYAHEADEKLRKFRAVPTVEMLRTTWEKTANPYIRAFTYFPKVTMRRKVLLPRPHDSAYKRPVTAWLFFAPPEHHLARATDLILDVPGGGFISMTPEHHEERLRMWAVRTGKPVVSIDYGKAPEYPYPYAVDECFDAYRSLVDSGGQIVGMSGHKLNIILSGDSAGAHIATCVVLRILETQLAIQRPAAFVLSYATLDFNFTSWMTPANLRVLQSEQSSGHIPGLAAQKDHFAHASPLSMVGTRRPVRRRRSWRDALRTLSSTSPDAVHTPALAERLPGSVSQDDEAGDMADVEDDAEPRRSSESAKALQARVRFHPHVHEVAPEGNQKEKESPPPSKDVVQSTHLRAPEEPHAPAQEDAPLGTRLTMTSRTGYFQDRIISPSMMRAMAILYIGPFRNPEFSSDYYLSPILAPSRLLAQFPPLLMSCGEKDPFVDDTVIFAGRVREAKRARRAELDAMLAGGKGAGKDHDVRALKRERDLLASQGDEDWVTMHIFSEWSHGYLQMPMLMQEARTVINDLADWMDGLFAKLNLDPVRSKRERAAAANGFARGKRVSPPRVSRSRTALPPMESGSTSVTETEQETETDDVLTFETKKRASPPLHPKRRSSQTSPTPSEQSAPSSEDVLPPPHPSLERTDSEDTAIGEPAGTRFDLFDIVPQQSGSGSQRHRSREPSPGFLSRTATPGKAGQTISESELMRRRRLLDSHLIVTDPPR